MSDKAKFLFELISRYKEAVKTNEKYYKWCEENPDKYSWHYNGEIVPKAKINRLRIMISQEMIDYENVGGSLY